MEEFGEQFTVAFASIATEAASDCVCGGGGGELLYTPPPLAGSGTIYAKTTVRCSPEPEFLIF